ncbi:MAG: CPBP family intramembrane metalloprotease [Candidatus Aminicenantes bacterium]|nr:CPBP family intramembrane metalloprotease [Candidatus Aminicenantes bacterium]NLH77701.1 CPBP family intramembrane metalloprotease [Acidobacteriota bacterium]
MTVARSKREPLLVGAAGAIAAALFIALFRFGRLGPFDFWAGLAASIVVALVPAFAVDRGYARRLVADLRTGAVRKIALGIASAAALYGVFAVGRLVALRLFPFAAGGIAAVYGLKAGVALPRVVLLIGLIIGPGEELFWRGFFQERTGATTRPVAGFVLTALLYTAVHMASGNLMLVLAAAVCGVFWGALYLRFRSPLLNVVSHTLWDLAVFVVFPF